MYPPSQLPDRKVSETQFNIWLEELEIYLSQEESFRVFLPGESYERWDSYENNSERISEVKGDDPAGQLKARQRQLRTVLSMIGKCVSEGHYDAVMRHSTSMQWIYNMLRFD